MHGIASKKFIAELLELCGQKRITRRTILCGLCIYKPDDHACLRCGSGVKNEIMSEDKARQIRTRIISNATSNKMWDHPASCAAGGDREIKGNNILI